MARIPALVTATTWTLRALTLPPKPLRGTLYGTKAPAQRTISTGADSAADTVDLLLNSHGSMHQAANTLVQVPRPASNGQRGFPRHSAMTKSVGSRGAEDAHGARQWFQRQSQGYERPEKSRNSTMSLFQKVVNALLLCSVRPCPAVSAPSTRRSALRSAIRPID